VTGIAFNEEFFRHLTGKSELIAAFRRVFIAHDTPEERENLSIWFYEMVLGDMYPSEKGGNR
jgi:hypothetical protein